MEKNQELLLEIWQEACRHIEVNESLLRIASLLSRVIPLNTAILYYLEETTGRIERLGMVCSEETEQSHPFPSFDVPTLNRLARWCRGKEAVQFEANIPPRAIPGELVEGWGSYLLAVPLHTEHGTLGILLLSKKNSPFTEKDERSANLLCEPISVALENDRRLNELTALREAAEADKLKLLHRLGRETLTNEIVGAEGGLRAVLGRVDLVAQSDVPALILGETGSGKEVIARAVHEKSSHAPGPFIRVNCGAIPPELIDSELFGHERGSFTGASGTRHGWFERAHEGTLFLDEVGELPPAAQVRLLRVLQDGSFERVGGEKLLHVNVRVVAATHQDLARMVQQQRFREDLWYRLAVFPIVLPPLRERKEDIPALAEHFAHRAARRFGVRLQLPTPEDLAMLTDYDWPGNVRELASVLDRATILGEGVCLEVAKALGIIPSARTGSVSHPGDREGIPGSVMVPLDEAMRRHIEKALRISQGKIEGPGGVAELLNMNPHTLRARMRKLGLDWKKFRK